MPGTHVPASALEGLAWTKSGRSGGNGGDCVEAAPYQGGVAIRNSKDPAAGGLRFTVAEFEAFVGGVKDGDFDHYANP